MSISVSAHRATVIRKAIKMIQKSVSYDVIMADVSHYDETLHDRLSVIFAEEIDECRFHNLGIERVTPERLVKEVMDHLDDGLYMTREQWDEYERICQVVEEAEWLEYSASLA